MAAPVHLLPPPPEDPADPTTMLTGPDDFPPAGPFADERTPNGPTLGFRAWLLPAMAMFWALLVTVAAAGTWTTVSVKEGGTSVVLGSVRGTSTTDGKTTLILGFLATAIMLVRTWRPARWSALAWSAPAPFVLAALIGGYDWRNEGRFTVPPVLSQVQITRYAGWGLMLLTVSAAAGGVLALAAAVIRPRKRRFPPEPIATALPRRGDPTRPDPLIRR
jgi:hypothetical protein